MSKIISYRIDCCGQCKFSTQKINVKMPGFYCRLTDSWIDSLKTINKDCPFPDSEE